MANEHQVCVVTGSSSGIGAATGEVLPLDAGFRLARG